MKVRLNRPPLRRGMRLHFWRPNKTQTITEVDEVRRKLRLDSDGYWIPMTDIWAMMDVGNCRIAK